MFVGEDNIASVLTHIQHVHVAQYVQEEKEKPKSVASQEDNSVSKPHHISDNLMDCHPPVQRVWLRDFLRMQLGCRRSRMLK